MFGLAEAAAEFWWGQLESSLSCRTLPCGLGPMNAGLTTGPDQAFDPIVLVGKSAVNQPDDPAAGSLSSAPSLCRPSSALYYSLLLTTEEFSSVGRVVPKPCGRIRAPVDARQLQINKSSGFEDSSSLL